MYPVMQKDDTYFINSGKSINILGRVTNNSMRSIDSFHEPFGWYSRNVHVNSNCFRICQNSIIFFNDLIRKILCFHKRESNQMDMIFYNCPLVLDRIVRIGIMLVEHKHPLALHLCNVCIVSELHILINQCC